MKPTFILSLFVTLLQATELTIINPWAETRWESGQTAQISYTVNEKGDKIDKISLDLMSGDPNDGLLILNIKDNFEIGEKNVTWKVEDLPSNKDYFLRIGCEDHFFFSHTFEIHGDGKYQLPKKPVFVQNSEDNKNKVKQDDHEDHGSSSSSKDSTKDTSAKSTFKKEASKGAKSNAIVNSLSLVSLIFPVAYFSFLI